MSSHQHNIVSRVGWLDFSIVTTIRWSSHPLSFAEFGKIRSGFSEIFFHKSSDRNGISRGWGQLLVSLVPDVDQLSEFREAFSIFLQSKKLRSMLITRMEKFLSSDAMVKSHPHRERGLLNYLVSQDSSSSIGRVIWLMDWMVLGSGFSDSGALLTLGRGTLRTAGLKSRAVSKSKM